MKANDKASQDFGAAFGDERDGASDREQTVRNEFWAKLKRSAGRIPFVDDAVAAYYCAMDSRTPMRVRGTLFGALAYFIMPADMIPDIIAGIGFTDDAAVLAAVTALLAGHIKPHHREAAAKALGKSQDSDDTKTASAT